MNSPLVSVTTAPNQVDVAETRSSPLALATSRLMGEQLQAAETAKRQEIAQAEQLALLKALLSSQADHD